MSTDDDTGVICGTGGTPAGEKTIVVYDGPLSVAIKWDKLALYNESVAKGMPPSKVQKRIERLVRMIESDWDKWADFVEEKLCLEYTRHTPHPENFEP